MSLDDLEADARVPLEEQVTETDLDPSFAVSEEEVRRNQVLRTIAVGGVGA
jgi:hypothetical protein